MRSLANVVLAVLLALGLGATRVAAQCDPFVYPANGQSIDFEGDYLFQATAVSGATAYLIGMFQNGVLVYENFRDDGNYDRSVNIPRGSAHRTALLPYIPTTLQVR